MCELCDLLFPVHMFHEKKENLFNSINYNPIDTQGTEPTGPS